MATTTETRLTGWAEVCTYLAGKYGPASQPTPNQINVSVARPGHEPAQVRVRAWDMRGTAALELCCNIGPAKDVPPAGALYRNCGLTIGGFALAQRAVDLRQILPLDGLRTADLDETIVVLAEGFDPASAPQKAL